MSSAVVVTTVFALCACTAYQPVQPGPGQSWAEARAQARLHERATITRSHRVREGESLSLLAQHYQVSQRELAAANKLQKPYTLRPGQVLSIPARSAPPAPAAPVLAGARPNPAAAGSAPTEALPPRPAIEATEVRVANLPPPAAAERGEAAVASEGFWSWFRRASGEGAERRTAEPEEAVAPRIAPETTVRATGEPAAVAVASRAAQPALDPATLERAQKTPPPPLSGRGFLQPVAGRVLSGFGDKPDGRRNDGINLAARKGTPVKASENGIVVFAGDTIAGFGNLVLIRHAEGWTSAYAHLDEVLVGVGDRVARGQPIGRVGDTGDVKSAQLHFQLRQGRTPVDPRPHLVDPALQLAAQTAERGPGG
ncbi:MAG: M23 family metallopeptidase [Geminicoccaceae bacterium]|nr:M23 family metallopeptidase [Geminicoccaceae bacterium]